MKEIKVIVKKVNGPLEVKVISDSLEIMQGIVGGYIETSTLDNDVVLICNEEGKMNGLRPNLLFPNDIIVGDVFFVSDGDDGEFASLTDDQIEFVSELIKDRQIGSR
jgi:hypothetical protein